MAVEVVNGSVIGRKRGPGAYAILSRKIQNGMKLGNVYIPSNSLRRDSYMLGVTAPPNTRPLDIVIFSTKKSLNTQRLYTE